MGCSLTRNSATVRHTLCENRRILVSSKRKREFLDSTRWSPIDAWRRGPSCRKLRCLAPVHGELIIRVRRQDMGVLTVVGVGHFSPPLPLKYACFHWGIKHNLLNPTIPFFTLWCPFWCPFADARFMHLRFGGSRFATISSLLLWSGNAATGFGVCLELFAQASPGR